MQCNGMQGFYAQLTEGGPIYTYIYIYIEER